MRTSRRNQRQGASIAAKIKTRNPLTDAVQPLVEQLEERRLLSAGTIVYGPTSAAVKGFQFNYQNGTTTDASGRLYVAGYIGTSGVGTGQDVAVARYTAAGVLDTTYGSGGVATIALPGDQQANAIAIDQSGRAVVAGMDDSGAAQQFAAARFTTTGAADTSFDADGFSSFTFAAGQASVAYGVAIAGDGSPVVAGTEFDGTQYEFALAKLNNANGSVTTQAHTIVTTGYHDQISGIARDVNGNFVVAGTTAGATSSFVVARYTSALALDTTYNSGGSEPGVKTLGFGMGTAASGAAVALQADGKAVVAGTVTATGGTNPSHFGVARFKTDGTLDTSFNGVGYEAIGFAGSPANDHDLGGGVAIETVDNTQKIVVSGSTGSNGMIAVARFNLNGSLDTTFNGTGKEAVVDSAGANGVERVPGLAIQPLASPNYANNIVTVGVDTNDQLVVTSFDGRSSAAAQPNIVYVNDDWADVNDTGSAGLSTGDTVYDSGTGITATYGIDAFNNIQNGITAVATGGTVDVLAGTYTQAGSNPSVALINKSLNLIGANAGTSGTATRGAESIIDGESAGENYYIVDVEASNVTVSGFEIRNPSFTGSADASGILVGADGGPRISNVHITDNIIHDVTATTRPHASFGTYGINEGPVENIEIDNNLIYNIGNADTSGNSEADGILTWGNDAGTDSADTINIHDNTIHDVTNPGYAVGIRLGGDSQNATINHNVVSNVDQGIRTSTLMSGPASVTNNTLTNVHSLGIGLYTAGETISSNIFAGTMLSDGKWFDGDASYASSITSILSGNTFPTAVVDQDASLNYRPSIWANIQGGVDGATAGDTVNALNVNGVSGTKYIEDVTINKDVTVNGAGPSATSIVGTMGDSNVNAVYITANGATLQNFTVTRQGDDAADWTGQLDNQGVIFAQNLTAATVQDCDITGNRNGIYVNTTQGIQILNNVIDGNWTGIQAVGNVSNLNIENNFITNNFTAGLLFNTGGSATSTNIQVHDNLISGNWYGGIVRRWASTNVIDASGNSFGTTSPVYSSSNTSEPAYGAASLPAVYGGTATAPATLGPDVADVGGTAVDFTPYLDSSTDTDLSTYGFQGSYSALHVTSVGAQAGSTGRIQEGINLVTASGTVHVTSGTYKENPNANKAVTLLGANAGTAGSSISRGAESHVITSGDQTAVFTITSNNVTIDGFTIDGDDPSVGPSAITSPTFAGDDDNATYGIRPTSNYSHINVQNNVVERVAIGFRGDGASQNNSINHNLFDSIGNYDFGYGVSLRTNYYANVTDNVMTRVWTGIHTNNFNGSGGPATWNITGNDIQSYAGGLLSYLNYNQATAQTITGNTFSAAPGAVANNFGVLIASLQDAVNPTFTNNTISGTDYGIAIFNAATSHSFTLDATDSITGTKIAGVLVTDNLYFANSPQPYGDPIGETVFGTGAAQTVNINGTSISVASGDGVKVDASNGTAQNVSISGASITGAAGSASGVNLSGGTLASATVNGSTIDGFGAGILDGGALTLGSGDQITNGTNGLVVNGSTATIAGNTLGNLVFSDQSGQYILLENGALHGLTLNATGATFDGHTGATASIAQNYAIEDKITHAVDDETLGFVRVKAATVFVTPNSGSIQRGVDAASSGDTVYVEAGTYDENVTIGKNITLLADSGPASTIINGTQTGSSLGTVVVNNGTTGIQIGDAIGEGFTINGIDGASPGIEAAALYFQGDVSGAKIIGNTINAAGDEALLTEYGAHVSNLTVDHNTFGGKTFIGTTPGDNGFTNQFTDPNVPRQLVVISGGTGGGNTSNITFTNNNITGTAGGTNGGGEQGNNLVSIDSVGATITGNQFTGFTNRYGDSLRVRGTNNTVSTNDFGGTAPYSLEVAGPGTGNSVTGNTFHAINSQAQATISAPGVTITGNTFTGSEATDVRRIELTGGPSPVTVYGSNAFSTAVLVLTPAPAYLPDIWANIQGGVDAASTGGTVIAEAGTYVEQVDIGKDITLSGVGDSTLIQSPATLSPKFNTSVTNDPIVFIHSNNVDINHLKIDGLGLGNANYRFEGIGVHNGGGTIDHVTITGIRNTPFDGSQSGVAIYAYNDDSVARSLAVTNNTISDYQKGGITANGVGLTATITGNDVTGSGPTATIAQNGIQIGFGASGTVSGNTVSGNDYTLPTDEAADVLLYQAGTGTSVTNNTLSSANAGVDDYNSAGTVTITGNHISTTDGDAIVADDDTTTISGNDLHDNTGGGVGVYDGATASISDNTFTNNAVGIEADSSAVTIDSNTLTNNTTGIDVENSTSAQTISNNTLSGGTTGVIVNAVPTLNYTNNAITGYTSGGDFTAITTVNYTTSNANDTFVLNAATMQDNSNDAISYSGITTLNVYTLDGNDAITIGGEGTGLTAWVDAGNGTDTLDYVGTSGADNIHFATAPTLGAAFTSTESVYRLGGTQRVNMLHVENRQIHAGAGNDTVAYDRLGGSLATGFYINGGDGNDSVTGGLGNDSIDGGNGSDSLDGSNGDDVIQGNGNATADAESDKDSIYGGVGNDTLTAGTQTSQIYGQNGNDTIFCQNGVLDFVDGGAGFDVAYADNYDLLSAIEQVM